MFELLLIFSRIALAAVFAVAGLTKLFDRAGSRQAMVDFGVPTGLAGPLGTALPLAELAVAAALLPVSTAWTGAAGALALLLLFCAGIGLNLARGRRPDCRCFGQIQSSPVGWQTLARNGALAALAGIIIWLGRETPGPSLIAWAGELSAVQVIGIVGGVLVLALVTAQGWLVLHLLRQQGRLLLRIEALEAGGAGITPPIAEHEIAAVAHPGLPLEAVAPAFTLPDIHGKTVALDDLRAEGAPVLLLFTDPHCGPCTALMPEIGRWQAEHAGQITITLIGRGDVAANRAKAAEHGIERLLLQPDDAVADAYQAYGTPSAVLVRPDGTVGSAVASGADAIRALVSHAVGSPGATGWIPQLPIPVLNGHDHGHHHDHDHHHGHDHHHQHQPGPAPAARFGEPAPALALPDLDGALINLADFRGREIVVLFWNPGCGYCQQMLPDLQQHDAEPPAGAPALLIVSGGDVEANRAMRLRSPVVLDEEFAVGQAFGIGGTPMAILIDAEGRIASEPAAGVEAVLTRVGASGRPAAAAAR